MVAHSEKVRASKVLASAKALGLNVHDADLHRALKTHNAPHDHVFDKNLNSTARLFLRNVAKHKATPKMPKVAAHVSSPPAVRCKTILLVDSDRQRRDDLTTTMSSRFKVVVAGSTKDALQVLQMINVHVVLARLRFQKDTAIDFIHTCREKHMTVPIALHTSSVVGHEAMLAECVDAGACGFFEDSLPSEILCYRLLELTASFHVTDAEWREFMPQPANVPRTSHRASAVPQPIQHTVSARSLLSSSSGFRRSSKVPSTLTELDENGGGMAEGGSPNDGCMSTIDMQIQDRQNFLTKQEQIQKVMTIQHSVLGLRRSDSDDAQNEQPSTPAPLNPDLLRNEAAAPTHDQIIECMYTRPHVVATQAQEHDYAIRTRPPRDAVPQEPLLTHCIIVDPSTLCDSKTVLKRINRAYLALQVGEYDRAIQWCTASLKAEPNHLTKWCHLLRGSVHDLLGDYTDALADFDAATRIDPAFHQAHFNRSVSLLKVGKDDLALDAIVAAQELAVGKADGHPVPTEYVRNHALILRRMGRYDEARLVYATLGSTSVVATASGAPTAAGEVAQTEAAARTGGLGYDSEKEQSLEHMLGNAGFTGGLFDALFCQSKDEKAACRAAPETRSPAMLDLLQSRLHQYDFFARCPPDILRNVCQALHYVVVRSGDTFYLAHDNPHAFYVCVSGTLSVHANLTLAGQDLDTMASSSTHRLRTGDVFGKQVCLLMNTQSRGMLANAMDGW
ncbi:hypothetical protein, variant [Aphanomyces invadans]|uniref:Cyclic nucleotide-binding domain-containing protein n=1 Tax=Aphanomyces invadans TaxID=157072 RepID=A0A024TJR2_9STRA|nr:hypothetical protein, variant [Aphanomyces invadans]ETV94370.1 hypothetical protein, variant [Aphanomyces invadans]|eukprot:XP_008877131.1 hypothetical protein, variant [Aphanomyces invadans]